MANDNQKQEAAAADPGAEQPIEEKTRPAADKPTAEQIEQARAEFRETTAQVIEDIAAATAPAQKIIAGLHETMDGVKKAAESAQKVAAAMSMSQAQLNEAMENSGFSDMISRVNGLLSFIAMSNPEQDARIKTMLGRIFEAMCENVERIPEWLDDFEELEALEPYLTEELEKPEYQGMDVWQLINESTDENGQLIPGSPAARALEAARIAMNAQQILPKLQSAGTVKYFSSPNTPLSNALSGDSKGELIGAGAVDLPVMAIGRKDETTIYAMATLENMEGVTITGKPWSDYDRAVHDAAFTIAQDRIKRNQPPLATSDMIYRQMTNKRAGEYVSPQQRGAVTRSIEKQRKNIRVSVDASEEMKRRKIEVNGQKVTKFKQEDFILPARKIEIQAGGENVTAYLFSNMILGEYAQLTGQITTIKTELLDIKEMGQDGKPTAVSLPNSVNRIAIKSYLMRRIKQAEHDFREYEGRRRKYEKDKAAGKNPKRPAKPNSNIILFETLFNSAEITAKGSSRSDAQKYIAQVLDFWRARGVIRSYKLRKREKGKGYDAVIIDF